MSDPIYLEVRKNDKPIALFEQVMKEVDGTPMPIAYRCYWIRFEGKDTWEKGKTYTPRLPKLLNSIHGVATKEITKAETGLVMMEFGMSD